MLDHLIIGATIVDGTGRARLRPATSACATAASSRSAASTEPAHHTLDADGLVVCPGLRRPAHPLRRAALLGSGRLAVERPRRHVGDRRQLLLRPGAAARRRRRLHAPHDGQGRGHAARRARAGRAVDVGELRRVPRRARRPHRRERRVHAGHSALRRYRARPRGQPSAAGRVVRCPQLRAVLADALAAGALGFSTDISTAHSDGDGDPVPGKGASREEIWRCARSSAASRARRSTGIFDGGSTGFSDDELDTCSRMSAVANRSSTGTCSSSTRTYPERVVAASWRCRTARARPAGGSSR